MKDELEKILINRNIRPTAMRILVLKELQNSDFALSLNELDFNLEQADKTTIFRTLRTFEENKLIHRIDDGSSESKFALCNDNCECLPKDTHAHFHCKKCNRTFCLNDYHLPKINLPKNFSLDKTSFVLEGICDKCSKIK